MGPATMTQSICKLKDDATRFPNAEEALLRIWRDAVDTRRSWADFDGRTLLEFVERTIAFAAGQLDEPAPLFYDSWNDNELSDINDYTWEDFPRRADVEKLNFTEDNTEKVLAT